MIAITILGIGLIMVATMFPVAWNRARELSEFTTEVSATEAAHAVVSMLARTDGLDTHAGSFAGDMIFESDTSKFGSPLIVSYSYVDPDRPKRTRVHELYMENLLVSAPQSIVPDRTMPWQGEHPPWKLEGMELGPQPMLRLSPIEDFCQSEFAPGYCNSIFVSPQVRFEQRLYPPLETRDPEKTTQQGEFRNPDPTWDNALDNRRYCWAVFSKLKEGVGPATFSLTNPLVLAREDANSTRDFTMYYVTLRRSRQSQRFARQDTSPDKIPNPYDTATYVPPVALKTENDVLLPEPWRVQVMFPNDLAERKDATGIPTEVGVNTEPTNYNANAAFVVDMFPAGTQFIDELSGHVYRVTNRRIAGKDQDRAYLTLQREVVVEDIDDGLASCCNGTIEPEEQLRTVWVFPPAVEAARGPEDVPFFVGKPPVVGIQVRTLSLTP